VESGAVQDRILSEATECLMIFVAVDAEGKPTPVPSWTPRSVEDRERQAAAIRLQRVRTEIETAMGRQAYTENGTAPRTLLRFLAAPTDVNWGGKVHGGIVMRWIDEAAHVLATQWTKSPNNVAVFAGGVRFYRPLRIGHLVEVEARLIYTGATSMHISVHVRSGDPVTGVMELTTHCLIIFVGLGEDGRPMPVPHWDAVSAEDVDLEEHARHLVELRRPLNSSAPA
jgi:acyl-CoA hydrolase